jgi:hypothetical protein
MAGWSGAKMVDKKVVLRAVLSDGEKDGLTAASRAALLAELTAAL